MNARAPRRPERQQLTSLGVGLFGRRFLLLGPIVQSCDEDLKDIAAAVNAGYDSPV